ncbi:hypothetical protein ACWDA3_25800, partial [Nonomuraea rubra]
RDGGPPWDVPPSYDGGPPWDVPPSYDGGPPWDVPPSYDGGPPWDDGSPWADRPDGGSHEKVLPRGGSSREGCCPGPASGGRNAGRPTCPRPCSPEPAPTP